MRNSQRLDGFYNDLKNIHQTYFSDLRFGQFIIIINKYIEDYQYLDPFYLEENEYLKCVYLYVEQIKK